MRHSLPTLVSPSNCTKGSITVSAPTTTLASITEVSGRKIVTPSAISLRAILSRSFSSIVIISAIVLAPSTSSAFSASSASTRSPAAPRIAAMSVR